MDLVAFPSQLPCPSPAGYQLRHVDPMVRTQLASGRARQRRRFTSVPTEIPVSWTFTQPQMQLFEVWYRYSIDDGVQWFSVRLQTPLGIKDYRARFTGIYRADLLGADHWRVTAEIELYERQTLPKAWGEFPDYIVGSSIIDKAVNREWPEAP